MKLHRLLLIAGAMLVVAGTAYFAQEIEPTGARVSNSAQKLLASLSPEQKSKAVMGFDSKERSNWNFVPLQTQDRKSTRKGLPFEDLTTQQQDAARSLLRAATSDSGFKKATTIMGLEKLLNELENGGAMVRNPGWYFFTLFGTPSKTGHWGFRIEGHHLSLNFTLDQGQIVGFTPCFFGANPADIKEGPRKGERVLAEAEDKAKQLFASLDAEQRKAAFQTKQFPEIEQGKSAPKVGDPVGLAAGKMTAQQKEQLRALLQSYLDRVPPDVVAVEKAELEKAGFDKIYFAFAQEEDKPGKPYSYRVQGPTFVVEFLNIQADAAKNPANHIHSSWRKIKGDFGVAGR